MLPDLVGLSGRGKGLEEARDVPAWELQGWPWLGASGCPLCGQGL